MLPEVKRKLGYLGVFCIQLSYLPQLYKVISTREVNGISPLFIFMVWLGIVSLQIYSYSIRDKVYIFSNWCGLINTSLLLILIWLWS
jgi:uncharacterized protein with PQ loop repeat